MSRLMIYDTSNFTDFPIGGQLTSISNFLRYICEEHPERVKDIFLIGVTTQPEQVGSIRKLFMYGKEVLFMAAAMAQRDLGNTGKSLRLQYVKGLFKYAKQLKIRKDDCNYIHSPEAYGVVKFFCPGAKFVIFSHGSYFNMTKGFRFFQNNRLVNQLFPLYLKWILRNADMIFVLDKDSLEAYRPYQANLVTVSNSIVCPELPQGRKMPGKERDKRILFVGRLSKDKQVGPIIQAVKEMPGFILTVVGDGEAYDDLIRLQGEKIRFAGAVAPAEVAGYMQEADILVMNSSFEGVPMTILEALSNGLPVVSTNVGGIASALHFGQDSEESDATPESIRRAIERILISYQVYSSNAWQNALAFDYRQVNQRIFKLLKQFWGGGRK